MRRRLTRATLESLAEDGYAASTLSRIVKRAGVSRGAQVHHYPNKQALILDAAESLIRRSYKRLGELVLSVAAEDDRLHAVIQRLGADITREAIFPVYQELLTASQHDPELAEALRHMLSRMRELFAQATAHYFAPRTPADPSPAVHFEHLALLLTGLSAHRHLVNRTDVESVLNVWMQGALAQMRARPGIHSPPPRAASGKE